MAEHDRRDETRFRDAAERGGRALGGGVRDGGRGVVGYRPAGGGDEGRGHSGYRDDRGGFVDDYRGGPGSGGYARDKGGRGSGLGAFGFDDDTRPGDHRGRGPKGYARSDERIREDVNDRLTDDPHVDASEIEVTVQNREVTLSGTVNSRSEKRRAEDIAESVSGVTHVQNNLRVQSQMATLMGGGAGESSGAGVTGTGPTGMAGGTSTGSPGASTVEVSRAGGTNRKTGTRT